MDYTSHLDIGYLDLENLALELQRRYSWRSIHISSFLMSKNVLGNVRPFSNVPVWSKHTENNPIFWK